MKHSSVSSLRKQIRKAQIAGANEDFIQRLRKELNETERKQRHEDGAKRYARST